MSLEIHSTTPPGIAQVARPRAVYAGTFDPITAGHLSVVRRAAPLFEELIVLVAVNPDKAPLFPLDERLEMILEATAPWPHVGCASTTGYVVDFAAVRSRLRLIHYPDGFEDTTPDIPLCNQGDVLVV